MQVKFFLFWKLRLFKYLKDFLIFSINFFKSKSQFKTSFSIKCSFLFNSTAKLAQNNQKFIKIVPRKSSALSRLICAWFALVSWSALMQILSNSVPPLMHNCLHKLLMLSNSQVLFIYFHQDVARVSEIEKRWLMSECNSSLQKVRKNISRCKPKEN